MHFEIETEEETGKWIAEIRAIPGCMVYGDGKADAVRKVKVLALHIMAEQIEHGEQSAAYELFIERVADRD